MVLGKVPASQVRMEKVAVVGLINVEQLFFFLRYLQIKLQAYKYTKGLILFLMVEVLLLN